MGNRDIDRKYQEIPGYSIYDKETPSMRRSLHRRIRRKVKILLHLRSFDALPIPRRTQGWETW